MKRAPNVDKETGMDQDKCPQCGKFLPYDETKHFYACCEKVPMDEWDMHPVAAFCSDKCADRFHA